MEQVLRLGFLFGALSFFLLSHPAQANEVECRAHLDARQGFVKVKSKGWGILGKTYSVRTILKNSSGEVVGEGRLSVFRSSSFLPAFAATGLAGLVALKMAFVQLAFGQSPWPIIREFVMHFPTTTPGMILLTAIGVPEVGILLQNRHPSYVFRYDQGVLDPVTKKRVVNIEPGEFSSVLKPLLSKASRNSIGPEQHLVILVDKDGKVLSVEPEETK
jgi:hypothetical protein